MGFDWRPRFTAPFVMRVAGLLLFVCSYFLPAVANREGGGAGLRGWSCAYLSLSFLVGAINDLVHARVHWQEVLVGSSGLNNLLVPGFLLVRRPGWQVGLGIVTTLCAVIVVPAAVHALEMKAIVGCYLWMGGTLLVLVSGFLPVRLADRG
jgi:hypothetical protein